MRARVIVPPDPIVAPEDIVGATAGDASVAALIQAVTEDIDGPGGWLGRSLGPQTIEVTLSCWPELLRLPYGPVIEVEGVSYIDTADVEQAVDGGAYFTLDGVIGGWNEFPVLSSRPHPVKVTYRAGYDGETTGEVPERARQAIILSVQHLRSLRVPSLYLRADEVEGIGRKEFTLSDQAGRIVRETSDRLLSTLLVYR